jgi:streptomycin 6-kinase
VNELPLPAALPPEFARFVISIWGATGAAWLERLPGLVDEYVGRWSLESLEAPFEQSYNYVLAARRYGEPVVLKLGVLRDELRTELAALQLYGGDGVVRVLEADPDNGALLLERLLPGEPLADLALEDDEAATAIAAQVLARWRRPAPVGHAFPTVADWGRGFERIRARFDGGTGPLPAGLTARAESLFAELLASSGPPVVLHGDLHHANILSATREPWLVIDPKGVVGEAEYEVGALLRNPSPEIAADPAVAAHRIAQLADLLGFDRRRIRDWAFAQAILSAWWGVEDGQPPNPRWLTIAETLAVVRI